MKSLKALFFLCPLMFSLDGFSSLKYSYTGIEFEFPWEEVSSLEDLESLSDDQIQAVLEKYRTDFEGEDPLDPYPLYDFKGQRARRFMIAFIKAVSKEQSHISQVWTNKESQSPINRIEVTNNVISVFYNKKRKYRVINALENADKNFDFKVGNIAFLDRQHNGLHSDYEFVESNHFHIVVPEEKLLESLSAYLSSFLDSGMIDQVDFDEILNF